MRFIVPNGSRGALVDGLLDTTGAAIIEGQVSVTVHQTCIASLSNVAMPADRSAIIAKAGPLSTFAPRKWSAFGRNQTCVSIDQNRTRCVKANDLAGETGKPQSGQAAGRE